MPGRGRVKRARSDIPTEIWVLVVASFVIALGFGIVAPALPQYARSFGVGDFAASAVISAFALMRLLFAPMSGPPGAARRAGTSCARTISPRDLINRETSRQYAYEDRIAALRADVDRLASRALLDQDGVGPRVGEIAMRQAELESRQSLVNAVTESLQSAGIGVSQAAKNPLRQRMIKPEEPIRASGVTSFAPFATGKPTPAPETLPLRARRRPLGRPLCPLAVR